MCVCVFFKYFSIKQSLEDQPNIDILSFFTIQKSTLKYYYSVFEYSIRIKEGLRIMNHPQSPIEKRLDLKERTKIRDQKTFRHFYYSVSFFFFTFFFFWYKKEA